MSRPKFGQFWRSIIRHFSSILIINYTTLLTLLTKYLTLFLTGCFGIKISRGGVKNDPPPSNIPKNAPIKLKIDKKLKNHINNKKKILKKIFWIFYTTGKSVRKFSPSFQPKIPKNEKNNIKSTKIYQFRSLTPYFEDFNVFDKIK